MTRSHAPRAVVLLTAILMAACDRTPTDPALEADRDAVLLTTGGDPTRVASATSLPALFRAAVATVDSDQGRAAVQRLLASWRALNDEANRALRTGDRQTAQAKVAAVRAEQVRVVLRVLGTNVALRVNADVGRGLAQARFELANRQTAGGDVRRGRSLASQVTDLLQRSNAALQERDYARALDHATQASDVLDAMSHYLIELGRIPALETLFADAVAKVGRERGADGAAALLANLTRLNQEARVALRAGDRHTTQTRLEAVRREQIRIGIEVLGADVVGTLIDRASAGITATRARLSTIARSRDLQRAESMLTEAASLNARARTAYAARQPAIALDLASHAAGLVNALQHLLPH